MFWNSGHNYHASKGHTDIKCYQRPHWYKLTLLQGQEGCEPPRHTGNGDGLEGTYLHCLQRQLLQRANSLGSNSRPSNFSREARCSSCYIHPPNFEILATHTMKFNHLHPKSNHEKTRDNSKLRHTAQNDRPALFKTIIVLKNKETGELFRLQGTEDTGHLSAADDEESLLLKRTVNTIGVRSVVRIMGCSTWTRYHSYIRGHSCF